VTHDEGASSRPSMNTELAKAGVPVNEIRELAGHESIETTLRYMHSDRAAKRRAIVALRGTSVAATAKKKT
jgi:integrase